MFPDCPACGKASEGTPACPHCGAALATVASAPTRHWTPADGGPDPQDLLPQGQDLGGYRIERLLGYGGMGVVYLATQASLGRKVALKVLASRFAGDGTFVQRFEREAAALANLSHPHIVSIFDKGEHDGRFFFVMEYVEGVSLRQILSRGPLADAEAMRIVPPVCDALEYAHAQGIIHRDIKPENLLVARTGHVKIADFGLARLARDLPSAAVALTQTRTVMGTHDYIAPEVRQSARQADARADIYSLGVVLYEMLTGKLPLGRFDPPSSRAGVDPRLDGVVLKALEADPERRFQRASEVGRAVADIAVTPPPAEPPRGLAQALGDLQRSASVLEAPVRPPPRKRSRVSLRKLVARREGEGRRQWRMRMTAIVFMGLGFLAAVALLAWLDPDQRRRMAVPASAVAAVVAWAWWRRLRLRRKLNPRVTSPGT